MKKTTRYVIAAITFGAAFLFSLGVLVVNVTIDIYSEYEQRRLPPEMRDKGALDIMVLLVPAFSAVITATGTISTVILAWSSARRNKKEQELKIALLEQELEAARKTHSK